MEGEYYKTKESLEEYIKLADGINGSELIEKLKKVLPVNSTLLEIGSGPGSDWKILSNSFTATGSDNSAEFVTRLKSNNPSGEFLELDAVSMDTEHKFDGIYSNKVMHHLTDEQLSASIKRQHELLNTDGIICHSFWRGEGSEIFKGLFVNYHEEQTLREAFKTHFEIISLEKYQEFEADDSLLLIGKRR